MKGIEALKPSIDAFPENYLQAEQNFTPGLQEKCGVLGWLAWDNPGEDLSMVQGQFLDAAKALQHRGQQRTGIRGITPQGQVISHIGKGSVRQVFPEDQKVDLGVEYSGIIHNTWTTDLSPMAGEAEHPIMITNQNKLIIISHNGQLLGPINVGNKHPNDTHALGDMMDQLWAEKPDLDPLDLLSEILPKIKGSFSIVSKITDLDTGDEHMYAFRDPHGVRPLVLGANANGVVVASETAGLTAFDAVQLGEIEPGYIYRFDRYGEMLRKQFAIAPRKSCIFENIYLSRKTHINRFGVSYEQQRKRAGELLADLFSPEEVAEIQANKDDYIVVPIPATATPAGEGLADILGVKYEPDAIMVSKDYSRSYIDTPEATAQSLNKKFIYDAEKIKDKKLLVVDDSLVRGNTAPKITRIFGGSGAEEIHFLVASPRIEKSCNLGADIKEEELLAPGKTDQEILEHLQGSEPEARSTSKVKSVRYLPLDKLIEATGEPAQEFCKGCINGDYATDYPVKFVQGALERWVIHSKNFDIPHKPQVEDLVTV